MDKLILMILISLLTIMQNTFVKCAPSPARHEIPKAANDNQNNIDALNPDDVFDTESEKNPSGSHLDIDNEGLPHPAKEDLSASVKGDPTLIEADGKPNPGKKKKPANPKNHEHVKFNKDQDKEPENPTPFNEDSDGGEGIDSHKDVPREDGHKDETQVNVKENPDEIESDDPESREGTDAVSDFDVGNPSDGQKNKESESENLGLNGDDPDSNNDQDESVEEGDRDLHIDPSIKHLKQGTEAGAGDKEGEKINPNEQEENHDEDENGATLDENLDAGTNDDIDGTPPRKDTRDGETGNSKGDAKETIDESLEVATKNPQPKEEVEEDDLHEDGENPTKQPKDSLEVATKNPQPKDEVEEDDVHEHGENPKKQSKDSLEVATNNPQPKEEGEEDDLHELGENPTKQPKNSLEVATRNPQPKDEVEEDDSHEDGENPTKQPKDSDIISSNKENDDGREEAPVITASTVEKLQVNPSASSTPVKLSTEKTSASTKKSVITTRSTAKNNQQNTEGRTSQYAMPNLATSYSATFPGVPQRTSMAPYMSTTGSQQPGKLTFPQFYYTGPSSGPSFRGENYVTSSHRSTSMIEEATTPETSTESLLRATTTTATDLEINPETTPPPATTTTSTTTEEATTTPETASETTIQEEGIMPNNVQTEANHVLESTTTSAGVVVEPTTKWIDSPRHRKRPPVKPDLGREGGSSVVSEEEVKVEKETTTTTAVTDETTSANLSVSEKPGVISQITKYGKELVKQVGAFKVSLILLAIVALSFVSVFCCCKFCKRRGYRMRQRKLKEFGQEKEFLLRDRNKGNKYNNDTVTLLEGSSEDEF